MKHAQQHVREPAFGAQLRQLREAAGLTQEQLAERSGLTAKAISALERGERQRPYPHTVQALASALGLDDKDLAALLATVPKRGSAAATTHVPAVPSALVPPTALVGRADERVALHRLLDNPSVRLVTLLGPGGVGKTHLAQQIAADRAEQAAGGAAFVALAAIRDAALVIPAIAATLDVREAAGYAVREILQAYLGAKRMLLVLDNFEHVTAAAVEIAALLAACPQLTVLATSRAPLHIRGEHAFALDPLAVPALDQVPLVDDVAEAPAVQLFVARAQAVAPHFALTQANATIGLALTGAGYAALHLHDLEKARQQLLAGERALRAADALWYLALNLNMQAAITLPRGDYAQTSVLLRESISISRRLRDTWALPYALDGVAAVALANGEAQRAARLLGAADKLREPVGSMIGNAVWRSVYAHHVAALERMLDAETLAQAWAEGRAMQIEHVIALALHPTTA
jgi:transcriptional regulator with XRE-family HTH domain